MRLIVTFALLALIGSANAQETQSNGSAAAEQQTPEYAVLTTSMGEVVFRLRGDKAPLSVENFVNYVNEGFYEGTIFHRVVADFVVQGGGFTAEMKKKPTNAPIQNEANNMLPNKRGSVSMARTMAPHSATSQFYINVKDNLALDHAGTHNSSAWGYAVFAEVVRGMDVVDKMRYVPVGPAPGMPGNVPREPITIDSVTLLAELPAEPAESTEAGAEATDEASAADSAG